jgi:uncharacterized protein YjbI with pentapeptide repeats
VRQKTLIRKAESPSKRRIRWPRWTGFRGMSLRDWLDLLVVPLMLVALGYWFTTQQEARQQKFEDQREDQAQRLENQRSQDTALQAYFDSMTNLLIDEQGNQLRKLAPGTAVERLIQARTETLFAVLDKSREVSVVLFLSRSDIIPRGNPLVSLAGIDLSSIDLRGIDLSATSLEASNLANAILTNVNLSKSDLSTAKLSGAKLRSANLSFADLSFADLRGAKLRGANLSGADLSAANLSGAKLHDANLSDALLSDANLSGASGVTKEGLEQQAGSLEGAIMPDGSQHP